MVAVAKKETTKNNKVESHLNLPVYEIDGTSKTSRQLNKKVFAVKVNKQLLAQYVRVYLNNQRQGTASAKTRGEVIGSTRKIYRQKGTGKARHGSIKAPIFVGGGVVGGPKPKDYSMKINSKQKIQAMCSALTLKNSEKSIYCFSNNLLEIKPKTKLFTELLKKISINDRKILIIHQKSEKNNLLLAARNIKKMSICQVEMINPYIVLNSDVIMLTESSLDTIEKITK